MVSLTSADFAEAEATATRAIKAAYMVMVTGRRIAIPETVKSLLEPLRPKERFQGANLTPPSFRSILHLCDVLDQGCESIDRVSDRLSSVSMGVASDADVHEPNAHRLAWSITRRLWFDCRDGLMVAATLGGDGIEDDGCEPGTWRLQHGLLRDHWPGMMEAIGRFPAFDTARIKAMVQAESARAMATPNRTPDTKPDTRKKYRNPVSPQIRKLYRLMRSRPAGRTILDCAREIVGDDDNRASNLIRQASNYPEYKEAKAAGGK